MKYTVKTSIEDKTIYIAECCIDTHGNMESITQRIVDTEEEQIKKALIQLGWTPPKDAYDEADRIYKQCGEAL